MKIQYRLQLLTFLAFITFGCQTEDLTETQTINNQKVGDAPELAFDFDVEVKNDMLSFATREDYDAALELLGPLDDEGFKVWEDTIGFISMRRNLSNDEIVKRGIEDNLVATLINEAGQIEIAGNVFILDKLT